MFRPIKGLVLDLLAIKANKDLANITMVYNMNYIVKYPYSNQLEKRGNLFLYKNRIMYNDYTKDTQIITKRDYKIKYNYNLVLYNKNNNIVFETANVDMPCIDELKYAIKKYYE